MIHGFGGGIRFKAQGSWFQQGVDIRLRVQGLWFGSRVLGVVFMVAKVKMQDFRQCIEMNLTPARGRRLHTEVLTGTYDFRSWFEGLGLKTSGLSIAKQNEAVNHSFQLIPRSRLKPNYTPTS